MNTDPGPLPPHRLPPPAATLLHHPPPVNEFADPKESRKTAVEQGKPRDALGGTAAGEGGPNCRVSPPWRLENALARPCRKAASRALSGKWREVESPWAGWPLRRRAGGGR